MEKKFGSLTAFLDPNSDEPERMDCDIECEDGATGSLARADGEGTVERVPCFGVFEDERLLTEQEAKDLRKVAAWAEENGY